MATDVAASGNACVDISTRVLQERNDELRALAARCARSFTRDRDAYVQDTLRYALGCCYSFVLQAELLAHLGYEKSTSTIKDSNNRRNGFIQKKVRSSLGTLDIMVPRDRDGSFNPIAIRKHSRAIASTESRVLSMFAHIMSEEEIKRCVHSLYGLELGSEGIAIVTESILQEIAEQNSRKLQERYAFVLLSRLDFPVFLSCEAVHNTATDANSEVHSASRSACVAGVTSVTSFGSGSGSNFGAGAGAGSESIMMSLYVVQGIDENGGREILDLRMQPKASLTNTAVLGLSHMQANVAINAVGLLQRLKQRGVQDIVVVATSGDSLHLQESEAQSVFAHTTLL